MTCAKHSVAPSTKLEESLAVRQLTCLRLIEKKQSAGLGASPPSPLHAIRIATEPHSKVLDSVTGVGTTR